MTTTNERTNGRARRVVSYRGPTSGAIIGGEHVQTIDRPAARPTGPTPAAELHRRMLGLGPIARLDLLDEALERARREGAAAALEAAADGIADAYVSSPADYLQTLAQQHRAELQ